MSRNENAKQQLSISFSIMLPMEMTRAALRLIEGSDFPWEQADITAEPVRQGWYLMYLSDPLGVLAGYEDATNDEVLRTVHIKGYYLGRGGAAISDFCGGFPRRRLRRRKPSELFQE